MSKIELIHGSCADQVVDAVITSSFNLNNAQYIIHAVGPDFGRTPNAYNELLEAYYNSLIVLKENNLHSISFPLISSGIFGGNIEKPARESAKQCMAAYKKFIGNFPEYDVNVKLCAFSSNENIDANEIFLEEFNKN